MENTSKAFDKVEDKRTAENGLGYKVHLFVHVFDKYVVWIRNGQDISKAIKTRRFNKKGIERVVYNREDVTSICANLVPIDQVYNTIPAEITEAQWKEGPMKREIDRAISISKNIHSRTGFGKISFKAYIAMRKAKADTAIRVDFSS